ncbi:MAG: hypothetical protein K0S33_977 [Bacteroidetes bacterium]|jgi:hypothetical protein|nr:hypothetical protein [Bacteroidota bacterium]
MYTSLLSIHSIFRWLVLLSLVYALYRAYRGWLGNKVFSKHDNSVRHWTATIAQVQMVLGIWLYFISPIIQYFLHNYKDAVHQREVRFFGMEHSLMMLIAVVLITIASMAAKRKTTDKAKFKTMAIWLTLALIVILIMIPWPFSSFTANRPYLRF